MDIIKGKEFWFRVTNRQKEILNGMQANKISEVHSDGDLTFHAMGKKYVLTTDGGLFVETSPLHVEHYDPVPRRWPMTGTSREDDLLKYYNVPPEAR